MKYYRGVYSNGYYGCEEETYFTAENQKEADEIFEDGKQLYGFSEPDNRFLDVDEDDEDSLDEAIEDYYMQVDEYSYFKEITKEEYEEHEGEVG